MSGHKKTLYMSEKTQKLIEELRRDFALHNSDSAVVEAAVAHYYEHIRTALGSDFENIKEVMDFAREKIENSLKKEL